MIALVQPSSFSSTHPSQIVFGAKARISPLSKLTYRQYQALDDDDKAANDKWMQEIVEGFEERIYNTSCDKPGMYIAHTHFAEEHLQANPDTPYYVIGVWMTDKPGHWRIVANTLAKYDTRTREGEIYFRGFPVAVIDTTQLDEN